MCEADVGKRPHPEWSWRPSKKLRTVDDIFFQEGDAICQTTHVKQTVQDEDPLPEENDSDKSFPCQLSGCSQVFDNVSSYEHHYNTCHRHVCSVCARVLPTCHLLNIHVLESHDSMFYILAQKQHMYECLVSGCGLKFPDSKERKDHLIKLHKYPANFRFDKTSKTREKPAKRNPKKSKQKSSDQDMETDSTHNSSELEFNSKAQNSVNENKENKIVARNEISGASQETVTKTAIPTLCDMNCDINRRSNGSTLSGDSLLMDTAISSTQSTHALTADSLSANVLSAESQSTRALTAELQSGGSRPRYVYKVPTNICFGAGSQKGFSSRSRGRGRGQGNRKHWHQRQLGEKMDTSVNIEQVNMADLAQALNT